MSVDVIKKEIFRFLKSDVPEVLAIKGSWGVGKTYIWKQILSEAKQTKEITFDKYSYVSLFGLKSIESFRYSIFEQRITIEKIGVEPGLDTFKDNWRDLETYFSIGKKLSRIGAGLPLLKKFVPPIETLSLLSVKDTIICIDDFERKGGELTPKDILGVISELKERKNCKVVLILNDESFDGEKLEKEYKKYKEKVIDIELLFDPTAEECVDIAIDKDDPNYDKLRNHLISLKVNNIRIIKKIERLVSMFFQLLQKYEAAIMNQTIHSLVLFSWCNYHRSKEVPSLDFIRNIGSKMYGNILDKEKIKDENERAWLLMLKEYSFMSLDEFDLEVIKAVETGIIDELSLIKEAEIINKRIIATNSANSFHQAWDLYRNSFDDNEDEIVNSIIGSYKENIQYISLLDLNGVSKLLEDLDRVDLADEVIEFFIKKNLDNRVIFNIGNYPFASSIDSERLIAAFSKINDVSKCDKTVDEVLGFIIDDIQHGVDYINILAEASVDEYYEVFKRTKGKRLHKIIKACLDFRNYSCGSDKYEKIVINATIALSRIGSENRLNSRRVANYGVKVDCEG